jgi:hypothetical protein
VRPRPYRRATGHGQGCDAQLKRQHDKGVDHEEGRHCPIGTAKVVTQQCFSSDGEVLRGASNGRDLGEERTLFVSTSNLELFEPRRQSRWHSALERRARSSAWTAHAPGVLQGV